MVTHKISFEATADTVSLKLHVDEDGIVWFGHGDSPPACSGRRVIGFMLMPLVCRAAHVRLLGTAANAHLITAMYARKLKHGLAGVEIGSPACLTAAQRHDPASAILAMRMRQAATSTGGWHDMDRCDYYTYALISQMQKTNGVDDHALRLLKGHPVWPALSFIHNVSPAACCRLLSMIIDPRWYIDSGRVDRASKLMSYLDLTPASMRHVLSDVAVKAMNGEHIRCRVALACWRTEPWPNKEEMKQPGAFLWRAMIMAKNLENKELRATQLFINYLRHNWLQALCGDNQSEALFVPEYFFKTPQEIVGYNAHMERMRNE